MSVPQLHLEYAPVIAPKCDGGRFSTSNISVIGQETYLRQAQTTEVVAKAAWLKASAQLDRVLGQTLEKSGISLKHDQLVMEAPQH